MTEKRPPSKVHVVWAGDRRFDTGRPGGPIARIDGDGATGQSPPDALLSALATCSAVDLVDILAKRRTPVERLTVDVEGERRETNPRRFVRITLTYNVEGPGVEAAHAERAVALAFEKYCTVAASLAPDIVAETIVVTNGVRGSAVRQPIVS